MGDKEKMIKISNVRKDYFEGNQVVHAIEIESLHLDHVGLVCIVGESGCGKTTLLNLLSGLEKPSDGDYWFNGEDTTLFSRKKWEEVRNIDLGVVFQNYSMLPKLTVLENVELALAITDEKNRNSCAMEALRKVGICEQFNKKIENLSGGQKQRAAVARAIVKNPKLLLADEPTGNLDSENSKQIFELLKAISKDTLVVVVTHDQKMAEEYADRIIELSDGKIVSDKYTPNEVRTTVNIEKNKYSSRYMSLLCKAKLVKCLLGNRLVRGVLTCVIFALSNFLFILCGSIMRYDTTYIVGNGAQKLGDGVLVPRENEGGRCGYLYEDDGKYINTHLLDTCIRKFGAENVFLIKENVSVSASNGIGDINHKDEITKPEMITAALHYKADGHESDYHGEDVLVDITDFVAEKLGGKNTGDRLYIGNMEVIVNKVISTDYGSKKRWLGSLYSDEREYLMSTEYAVIWIGEDFLSRKIETNKRLYIKGGCYIGDTLAVHVNNNQNVEINCSLKDNEVIITTAFISQLVNGQYKLSGIKGTDIEIRNLNADRYNGKFNGIIDLYSIFGGSVKITDVIEEKDVDYYVSEDIFYKMSSEYMKLFFFDKIGINCNKEHKKIVGNLALYGYEIDHPTLENIYQTKYERENLLQSITTVTILLAVLNSFLFITLIGYGIKDNAYSIGVLRAMGVTLPDIRCVFMTEGVGITIISELISLVMLHIGVISINKRYVAEMWLRPIDIFAPSPRVIISVVGWIFVYGLVVSIVAVALLTKKTVIENIKG